MGLESDMAGNWFRDEALLLKRNGLNQVYPQIWGLD